MWNPRPLPACIYFFIMPYIDLSTYQGMYFAEATPPKLLNSWNTSLYSVNNEWKYLKCSLWIQMYFKVVYLTIVTQMSIVNTNI